MKRGDTKAGMKANIRYFIKWSALALVIGSVAGAAGTIFSMGVSWATGFRLSHPSMLFFLPVSGLLIVWMYHSFHEEGNRGTNMVIDAISSNERVTPATGPLIFFSTILTHLGGGSSGREGAALQLGGSIGNSFGEWFKLDERDKKIAIMCGMSAVFSALFGTPVAAAIFSLEVVSIGVLYYAALVPCVFSSFLAVGIARAAGLEGEHFPVEMIPALDLKAVGLLVLLGILCAAVSILFCVLLHTAEHAYRKYFPDARVRILAGSFLFIALTLLSGTRDYCGSSMGLIESSIEGSVRYEAFLMKMLFTAVALGAGFKGGEIVPTLCVGAALGCAFGEITGFAPSLCAACGMAALFAGVTNCPITSLVIALELFGYEGMEYFSIIIAVAFALSGYYGLYASQKFVYSKTRTEFINRKSNG
ncbi:chloride channel protein [Clostridium sp. AT4]|jgi:H+/Cl- antiporter ClcA|uniref:chloride channel protein n=1 Tax=Clostridium sp. AT4 TaxID=1720194 RepID=UPI00082D5A10|nr:chloride channel protein [Clostridium sp. AT4]